MSALELVATEGTNVLPRAAFRTGLGGWVGGWVARLAVVWQREGFAWFPERVAILQNHTHARAWSSFDSSRWVSVCAWSRAPHECIRYELAMGGEQPAPNYPMVGADSAAAFAADLDEDGLRREAGALYAEVTLGLLAFDAGQRMSLAEAAARLAGGSVQEAPAAPTQQAAAVCACVCVFSSCSSFCSLFCLRGFQRRGHAAVCGFSFPPSGGWLWLWRRGTRVLVYEDGCSRACVPSCR